MPTFVIEVDRGPCSEWSPILQRMCPLDKLVEHYSVLLPERTIRRITEYHAQQIFARQPPMESQFS